MDACKHNWHFIEGTERLRCERCKAETGPKSYEEKVQDILKDSTTMSSGWNMKDITTLTPTHTYAPYVPPKPVGAWVIDPSGDAGHGPCTMFHVFNKPTDEQIKNTEATFGWKWRDV
jgi:hypothetical protein